MNLFENVSRKLKLVTKSVFWIFTILNLWDEMQQFIAYAEIDFANSLWVLVENVTSYTLVLYILSLFVLCYGERVENTSKNVKISEKIYEKLVNLSNTRNDSGGDNSYAEAQKAKQNQTQQPPAQQPSAQQTQQGQSPVVPNSTPWFCTSCGTKNTGWYTTCSKCGKRKDG